MTLMAYIYPILRTANDVVRKMSKRPPFRTPFNSQHAQGSQTLPKSALLYFYDIFSSSRRNYRWKMSVLVIYEILGLFVNILTADHNYHLCNRENLQQFIKMQLCKKQRIFLNFCFISEIYIQIWNILKKRWPSYLMYFRNNGLRKAWLDKRLKNPVSEYSSTVNMLRGLK